jgi:hypothetical protein
MTALVDTDWYPASYPWHVVIELPRDQKSVTIRKGDPLCRVIPVRRDTYFAQQMSPAEFDDFFARGQRWLATHGRVEHEPRRLQSAAAANRVRRKPPAAVSSISPGPTCGSRCGASSW